MTGSDRASARSRVRLATASGAGGGLLLFLRRGHLVAVLASVGAAVGQGLLIKGGRYLEALAKADVLLVDKTGPLTLGRPQIIDTAPLDGRAEEALLHGESRTVRSGPR